MDDRPGVGERLPCYEVGVDLTREIAESVAYLGSDAALRSLEIDPYWPKWNSPWWHMLCLHELGEARQIPPRTATAMVAALDRQLHVFPYRPDEQAKVDRHRDYACHCAHGAMYQVLSACGIDVRRALPWLTPWFLRYQMADGGLSCDESAYLVDGECPSSMVGTLAPLEAMLVDDRWTAEERAFVDRAAGFLIARGLVRGSSTVHNAEERTSAAAWGALAFPRFYFYDVLRGLAALVRWAELTGSPLPAAVIGPVVDGLAARFSDGVVRVERRAYDFHRTTVLPTADRSPSPRGPTSTFALLEAASVVGAPSEALTRTWSALRSRLGSVRIDQTAVARP